MCGDIDIQTSGGTFVGGLVGDYRGDSDPTLETSYADVDIYADATSGVYAGGLVGFSFAYSGGSTTVTINESYASGEVTAISDAHSCAGGLVGLLCAIDPSSGTGDVAGEVTDCYARRY